MRRAFRKIPFKVNNRIEVTNTGLRRLEIWLLSKDKKGNKVIKSFFGKVKTELLSLFRFSFKTSLML